VSFRQHLNNAAKLREESVKGVGDMGNNAHLPASKDWDF